MKKLHKERLLQVVRVLDELPKGKKLDLGTWYECGTVACACGWSGQDPWFRRRGFRSEKTRGKGRVYFKNQGDGEAVQEFFGLSLHHTAYLFFPYRYERGSKRDVINRIKRFVSDG